MSAFCDFEYTNSRGSKRFRNLGNVRCSNNKTLHNYSKRRVLNFTITTCEQD